MVLHSALFRYSDNESQLAQLWRTKSPTSPNVTWRERWKSAAQRAADLGRRVRFYFTGVASPQAGMAALTGTLAGTRQG